MKVPRCKVVVIEKGEIVKLYQGPVVQMRQRAKALALGYGTELTRDGDGDYVIDLDQLSLAVKPPAKR